MKAPSFILGASLIFWGWQTKLLIPAVIMALVLEGSRLVTVRWDFSASDFNRISDLCTVIFLGMLIYSFASKSSVPVMLVVLQWLPMTFFLLMASLAYSTSEDIDISALFLLMRRKGFEEQKKNPITMNLTYPYFTLCILAASAANVRSIWFYVGLIFLSSWALLFIRPNKRYSLVIWASLLLLAGSAGYVGHVWLHRFQATVENKAIEWYSQFIQKEPDGYRAKSSIGDIGTLKLSDQILFRVKMGSHQPSPLLLREASYNVYRSSTWFARQSKFKPVQPTNDETTWELQTSMSGVPEHEKKAEIKETSALVVSTYLQGNKGILKLPMGAIQVEELPVLKMGQNQYGTVKVEDGPGLISYRVHYGRNAAIDSPPTEADLFVPPEEKSAVQQTIAELGPQADSPQLIMTGVKSHFRKNFSYSLTLSGESKNTTALGNFLLNTRSGHCEYFAASTVLILRALGIPARYAIGYLVHEFSDFENVFVVRQRHAHAWTLVYLDGTWHNLDTTPASWIVLEQKEARKWGGLPDLWSWCVYTVSKYRWSERKTEAAKHIGWLLIPLLSVLVWRVYRKKRVTRAEKDGEQSETEVCSGVDSEFYLIAERLSELGFVRHPGETLSHLIARVEEGQPPSISTEPLQSILKLHYRYRFDPGGISQSERSALRSGVNVWLEEHRT